MRFFDSTCHYVRLILDSMYSVRYFFLLFFVILLAFGTPLYFLSKNRAGITAEEAEELGLEESEYGPLTSSHFGLAVIDIAFNMYLLSLGEFESMENYDGVDSIPVWIIFFLATFVVQITFLNVLIAIMGDVYGEVMEKKDQARRREMIKILDDFISVIARDNTMSWLNLILTEVIEDTDVTELDLAVEDLKSIIEKQGKDTNQRISELEIKSDQINNKVDSIIEAQKTMLTKFTELKKEDK